MTKTNLGLYVRNFTFGVEDSLVSTVGLLSGVAVAGLSEKDIFTTGVILIFVEALSMGSGSFLSEHATEEIEEKRKSSLTKPITGAIIMFFSYIIAGLIPLLPYILFETNKAVIYSIVASLIGLIVLGVINAQTVKKGILRHALEMVFIGGTSILVGIIVGKFLGR